MSATNRFLLICLVSCLFACTRAGEESIYNGDVTLLPTQYFRVRVPGDVGLLSSISGRADLFQVEIVSRDASKFSLYVMSGKEVERLKNRESFLYHIICQLPVKEQAYINVKDCPTQFATEEPETYLILINENALLSGAFSVKVSFTPSILASPKVTAWIYVGIGGGVLVLAIIGFVVLCGRLCKQKKKKAPPTPIVFLNPNTAGNTKQEMLVPLDPPDQAVRMSLAAESTD